MLNPLELESQDKRLLSVFVVIFHPRNAVECTQNAWNQRETEANLIPDGELEFDELRNLKEFFQSVEDNEYCQANLHGNALAANRLFLSSRDVLNEQHF